MFIYLTYGPVRFVPVGVVVISLFLLIYTLLTSVCRSSKAANRSFILIIIASVFGIINGACLLAVLFLPYNPMNELLEASYIKIFIPVVLFGLPIPILAWMAGITAFSVLLGKSIQVRLSYILTLIEFILIVVATAMYGEDLSSSTNFNHATSYFLVYRSLFTAIISLRWIYLPLFFSLVIQHRRLLSPLGKTILIVFGILSTIRLIAETVLTTIEVGYGDATGFVLASFFFTDFIAVVLMALIVTYYRHITSINDTINDTSYDN